MSKEKDQKEILHLNKLESKEGVLKVDHTYENIQQKIYHEITGVSLEGDIKAPGNFITKRQKQALEKRCHVLYNYREGYIKLVTKENHPLKYNITGKLMEHPWLTALRINVKGATTGVKELTDLLKKYRFLFADRAENTKIIGNLQKFRVEATKFIETHNDNAGNQKDYFEVKASSNIDLEYVLKMPVFIGQPEKTFKVTVCYNVRERNIELWLESPELIELLADESQKIIDEELKRIPETFVFIEQ